MISKLDFFNKLGVPFRLVYLPGDTPSEHFPAEFIGATGRQPRIEFYDRREPDTPDGQFTGGRYLADEFNQWSGGDVRLYGDVPSWVIDAHTMALVCFWLDLVSV